MKQLVLYFIIGIGNLSLFGTELDTYDPRILNDDVEDNSGEVGVLARSHVQAPSLNLKQTSEPLERQASCDLLSDILASQSMLHSNNVTIRRDGTLHSLPVRTCPGSGNSSPSGRSPNPSSSPLSHKNECSSFTGSPTRSSNVSSNYFPSENDLSIAKPSPVKQDMKSNDNFEEVYSEIDSNFDESENELVIVEGKEETRDTKNLEEGVDEECARDGFESDIKKTIQESDCKDSQKLADSLGDMSLKPNNKDIPPNSNDELSKTEQNKSGITQNEKVPKVELRRSSLIEELLGDGEEDNEKETEVQSSIDRQSSLNVHYPLKLIKKSMQKQTQENDSEKETRPDNVSEKSESIEETKNNENVSECELGKCDDNIEGCHEREAEEIKEGILSTEKVKRCRHGRIKKPKESKDKEDKKDSKVEERKDIAKQKIDGKIRDDEEGEPMEADS